MAAFGNISSSVTGRIMSEGFVADLSAETGDKDRWQRINRDRRVIRQKKTRLFLSGHKGVTKR